MLIKVYLRELQEEDADKSFKWRNDPKIWTYTGSRPDCLITHEIECEWIKKVLQRNNEKRFAICVAENDEYVGNAQLTNIQNGNAEFHIFIGEKKYWGKGIATQITEEVLSVAFSKLSLKRVYLYVSVNNVAAIKVYEKCGFKKVTRKGDEIKMEINI